MLIAEVGRKLYTHLLLLFFFYTHLLSLKNAEPFALIQEYFKCCLACLVLGAAERYSCALPYVTRETSQSQDSHYSDPICFSRMLFFLFLISINFYIYILSLAAF